MKIPNVFEGLLRLAGWLLWRPPMATPAKPKHEREPRPPRRPRFTFAQYPVPPEVHSIIRTTWYKNGRTVEVDEIQISEAPDALEIFHYICGGALRQGCDVTVLTVYEPEDLGVPVS